MLATRHSPLATLFLNSSLTLLTTAFQSPACRCRNSLALRLSSRSNSHRQSLPWPAGHSAHPPGGPERCPLKVSQRCVAFQHNHATARLDQGSVADELDGVTESSNQAIFRTGRLALGGWTTVVALLVSARRATGHASPPSAYEAEIMRQKNNFCYDRNQPDLAGNVISSAF